jgi:DNA uptake protein ComE-like DNA-binding protein
MEKSKNNEDSLDDSKYTYDQNDYKLLLKNDTDKKSGLFPFDPNNLPESDWLRLGLSEKQIKTIKNYEAKGGKFRKKEDVKKMYCISPELYASLEPYILVPADSSKTKHQKLLVELNSADTTELNKLKGIGSYFARKIAEYRDRLGGFVKKEQLLEIYGFDKEKYDGLSDNISVDISKAKKININNANLGEMKMHPYIKYNLANLIVNYRKQHGNYKSVDGIKQLDLVNDELFAKLAPYLTVE